MPKDLEAKGDSYNLIMLKLVCDRLAEAFAEKLHEDIRKYYWGYATDENLNMKEILKASYRGIRPAFGYPSLSDQSQMKKLFDLLDGEKVTGVKLTESLYDGSCIISMWLILCFRKIKIF